MSLPRRRQPASPAAAAPAEPLVTGITTGRAAFLALAPEWDALFARSGLPHQVFQSHVVLRHWLAHYADPAESLCIVTARRAGRLAMVWPLLLRRRLGFATLRFMGAPIAQFDDVLLERGSEAELLAAGWRAVRGLKADLFELRRLRADSHLAGAGLPEGAVAAAHSQAPWADLEARVGPEGPGIVYPARERSNHRRRLRRLAESGPLGFEALPPGPAAAAAARRAIAMKQSALLRRDVLAPALMDPRFADCFAGLAGDREAGTPLRVSLVTRLGEPIAIDLSLDCAGTTFGHVLAVDPDQERGGVGHILVHHSFASARSRGNARFDLLAPADPYKHDHADGMTGVTDFILPLSLAGEAVCALGLAQLRLALKAASRHLPSGLARRIAAWNRGPKG